MVNERRAAGGSGSGGFIATATGAPVVVHLIRYSPDTLEERDLEDVSALRGVLGGGGVTWIDVQGLGSPEVVRAVGELVGLHELVLEDVVKVPQRPKVETYDDHLLFIARMIEHRPDMSLDCEQLSIVLGRDYVITFQEDVGDVLDPLRARIRGAKGPVRRMGADYLAYAIIDAVTDAYFPIMEAFGEHLEALEQEILEDPRPAILKPIHKTKREMLAIRRGIWPQREAVGALIRDRSPFISEPVQVYLRDVHDHCVQVMDVVETYRELASGLMDVYLSSVSNRQNEVMKVLTMMATLFIPITFLSSVYGMNFDHMPELHTRWGYFALLGVMALISAGMIGFFHHKGWLGSERRARRRSRRLRRGAGAPVGRRGTGM